MNSVMLKFWKGWAKELKWKKLFVFKPIDRGSKIVLPIQKSVSHRRCERVAVSTLNKSCIMYMSYLQIKREVEINLRKSYSKNTSLRCFFYFFFYIDIHGTSLRGGRGWRHFKIPLETNKLSQFKSGVNYCEPEIERA